MGSMVARALGWPIGVGQTIGVSAGLLFVVIGNFMTKVRPNFLYGVRTPWTLSSEVVWDKTHRMAGPTIMAGGAVILVSGLLWPAQIIYILLPAVIGPALASISYSYAKPGCNCLRKTSGAFA